MLNSNWHNSWKFTNLLCEPAAADFSQLCTQQKEFFILTCCKLIGKVLPRPWNSFSHLIGLDQVHCEVLSATAHHVGMWIQASGGFPKQCSCSGFAIVKSKQDSQGDFLPEKWEAWVWFRHTRSCPHQVLISILLFCSEVLWENIIILIMANAMCLFVHLPCAQTLV